MNVEFDEDWEEWDPSTTPWGVHLVAGSLAGAAEHLLVFPLDTAKTFMQAESAGGKAELQALVKEQGRGRLWRGVSTTLLGCIPAHAGYFSIYEEGKVQFGADGPHHAPLAAAATGMLATVAHDSVMSPMDVIKQRMQLGFHSDVFSAMRAIARTEGVSSLYRSFPVTLAMNMPFAAVAVSTNESLKKFVGENSLFSFLLCGFVSGGMAGLLTTPLDVVRTRLNTQNLHAIHHAEVTTANTAAPTMVKNFNTSRFAAPRTNMNFSSALMSSTRKVSETLIPAFKMGGGITQRHPTYAAARLKYTRPVRCPMPIALWASPGTSTLTATAMSNSSSSSAAAAMTNTTIASTARQVIYMDPIQAAKAVWNADGIRGFFKGARQRMAVQAPGFAISWTAYETFKSVLTKNYPV